MTVLQKLKSNVSSIQWRFLLLSCSFEEAEALARRSLVIRERSFGSDDPLTASSLNNLALLLRDANQLPEAESVCRKCIEIRSAFALSTNAFHLLRST